MPYYCNDRNYCNYCNTNHAAAATATGLLDSSAVVYYYICLLLLCHYLLDSNVNVTIVTLCFISHTHYVCPNFLTLAE
jgi:hypothetical protein